MLVESVTVAVEPVLVLHLKQAVAAVVAEDQAVLEELLKPKRQINRKKFR
jgi:hypothetical protein